MILRTLGLVIFLVAIGLAATYWFVCPCETIPGGPLAGEEGNTAGPGLVLCERHQGGAALSDSGGLPDTTLHERQLHVHRR